MLFSLFRLKSLAGSIHLFTPSPFNPSGFLVFLFRNIRLGQKYLNVYSHMSIKSQTFYFSRLPKDPASLPCFVLLFYRWVQQKYWHLNWTHLYSAHLPCRSARLVGPPASLARQHCWPACLISSPALLARLPYQLASIVGPPALFWLSSLCQTPTPILKWTSGELIWLQQSTFL